MKKILSTLVFVFFTYCFYGQTSFEVGGIQYTTISATKVKVDWKNPIYSGDLNIPSTVTFTNKIYDVTSIGDHAFDGCNELTSIAIPLSVTEIGRWSFQSCTGLTTITIPNSVITIGYGAFQSCSNLTSITIPNSVTSIESAAFNGTKWYNDKPDGIIYAGKVLYSYKGTMPSNTTISILDGTLAIADYAFYYLSGLTSITIPNSVTRIGSDAFADCTNLTSITIPNSVTSIGGGAFNRTKWYHDKADGIIYVGKVLYKHKGTVPSNTTLAIIDGTSAIAAGAFSVEVWEYSGLTTITIPNSVTSIGEYAFHGCKSLTSITIPNSVTSIGDGAFRNCTALTSISIPATAVITGTRHFESAKNLKKIIGPAKLLNNNNSDNNEGNFNNNSIDSQPTSLDTVIINSGELSYSGIRVLQLSNKKLKYLDLKDSENWTLADESFSNFFNLDSIYLPNNLEKIKYKEFADCISLTSIKIPVNVTEIGKRAFENCRSLASVEFAPNSQLKTIDNWAFYACHGLQNITIPNGVTTVGVGAFWGCEYLSDLNLPSTVQKINDNGFDGCIGLNKIKVEATIPPTVSAKTFNRVNKNIPIYVPDESVTMYRNSFGWKDFSNIKGISTQNNEVNIDSYEIRIFNKTIELSNIENQALELFDISGRLIYSKINAENTETIELQHKGIYIIKIGNFNKKVSIN